MKRAVGIALASVLCASGCLEIEGDGRVAREARGHQSFVGVENRASLDVRVVPGDKLAVEVRVDANLLPHVVTRVDGDVLVVDEDVPLDPTLQGPHVLVTMPRVTHAALDGSGELTLDGFELGDPVALDLSGSGRFSFAGRAPSVDASLSGSGQLDLFGETGHVALELSGSGLLDARGLSATGASVELSGSGDVRVQVDGRLEVDLSGSGDVDVYGDADIDGADVSGSGKIVHH